MGFFDWFRKRPQRTFADVMQDIRNHPENHLHDFNELHKCCMVGGALDLSLLDAHGEHLNLGTNGGTKCDVLEGPCACGAWHTKEEMQKRIMDRQR